MHRIAEIEARYRAALEGCAVREAGLLIQRRCLTEHAQLRVSEGDNHRLIMGVAVRYGDEAKIWGIRERIVKGALRMPTGPWNLTLQHDRALPIGLGEFVEDDDALRFRCELTEGARQNQVLADVDSGLLRGASLEFIPKRELLISTDDKKGDLYEILEAQVLRLSLVDDGAYPQSTIELKMEPPAVLAGEHPAPRAAVPMLA